MLAVTNDCVIFQVFFSTPRKSFSVTLPSTEMRLTGPPGFQEFPGPSFLSFLKIKTMFISFQSAETSMDSQYWSNTIERRSEITSTVISGFLDELHQAP